MNDSYVIKAHLDLEDAKMQVKSWINRSREARR